MAPTLHLTLLAAIITAAVANCPSYEWTQYKNMCYWGRSDYPLHWNEVGDVCNSLYPGAEMVSIHDMDSNTFITQHVVASSDGSCNTTWIGLSRASSSSSWTWTDGSPYDFTQWYKNNPGDGGGNCALMSKYECGAWRAFDCTNDSYYFMCQVAAK